MKFHRNRSSRLGCRAVTGDTYRTTDRQPGSILKYFVKMTEFKKWAVTYVQQFWLGYLLVKSKLVNTDVTTKK